MKTFEPDKSNLSAYQLETFKEAASLRTPVSSIPGVGEITSKHFKEKFDLYTIGDVLNKISSYQDLIKILPKYVNSHRIYEALLKTFPDDLQKEDRSREVTEFLQKENERLQFLIKNYLREEKFLNNKVLTDITKRKIIDKNKSRNEDVKLDKKSVKRFIEKWEKGMTSSEIVRELKAENLFLKNEKKRGFKLNE